MKAAVYERYGGPEVVAVREVPRPEAGAGEILVRVNAASVTTADWRMRASAFPGVLWLPGRLMVGLRRPRRTVLGRDFAGVVVRVGAGVAGFRAGDRVFGVSGHGAHAEFVAVPAAGAVLATPARLEDAEAAALPFGALAALVFLRDYARVQAGQAVLVVGATGGVGAYAVQIAAALGAEVTGVASAANLDLVRGLGAAHALDYGLPPPAGREYDVIFDTVGATTFGGEAGRLREGGVYVPLNFGLREGLQALTTRRAARRVTIGVSGDSRADLEAVAGMVAAGRLRPVVDREYPLERIADAYRDVETRHRRGCVVVTVGEGQSVSSS
jgi:NADPH:quinone reductase-like Zn-dependent oxidoreductase